MEEFDYVIIGSGPGGSVLASRLSADPDVRILLLEAGHDWIPDAVDVPPAWFSLIGSDIDWKYRSTPQRGLNGRSIAEPRGFAPGGSSNLYVMMHVRGHPSDYDNWAYQGAAGWSYNDLRPYFRKLANQEDRTDEWTGTSGPQKVSNAGLHDPNPLARTFIDACVELGHKETQDFNGPQMTGVGWHHIDVADGTRSGVLVSYLEPVLGRPNLTLRTGALATSLDIVDGRCVGVRYEQSPASPRPATGGRTVGAAGAEPGPHQVRATREVLLCAGAMESPKLLMLSGIGPGDALRALDIPVVVDLPGVGANFHNHVLVGMIARTARPVEPAKQNLAESALFAATQPGAITPDLQLVFVSVPFDATWTDPAPNYITVMPGLMRPQSRGSVRLVSSDPHQRPLVDPNYYADSSDMDRMVTGFAMVRDIFATSAFAGELRGEVLPGPEVRSRADIVSFIRNHSESYHHQCGSCRMGIDDMAVVDPLLNVRGVSGLRVVDASVIPTVPSGNTHSPTVAIAERMADILTGKLT